MNIEKSLTFNDSVPNSHKFTELYLTEQSTNILPWMLSPQDAVHYCPPHTNPLDLLLPHAMKALKRVSNESSHIRIFLSLTLFKPGGEAD